MSKQPLAFEVLAGKHCPYDGENIKYADAFATFDEALAALIEVNHYPIARIEYNGHVLELRK